MRSNRAPVFVQFGTPDMRTPFVPPMSFRLKMAQNRLYLGNLWNHRSYNASNYVHVDRTSNTYSRMSY